MRLCVFRLVDGVGAPVLPLLLLRLLLLPFLRHLQQLEVRLGRLLVGEDKVPVLLPALARLAGVLAKGKVSGRKKKKKKKAWRRAKAARGNNLCGAVSR